MEREMGELTTQRNGSIRGRGCGGTRAARACVLADETDKEFLRLVPSRFRDFAVEYTASRGGNSDMGRFQAIDAVVLGVYLVGTTLLGIWAGRKAKASIAQYFMPRRFGKTMLLFYSFGTGTSSDSAVIVASATFKQGLSGIWYQWLWLPATPFYWGIAALMRRFRAITTADVLTLRFNRSVAGLFAVIGVVGMSVKIGLLLESGAVMMQSSAGFNPTYAIIITTVLFVLYGTMGGLSSVIVADLVQGLLTIVFSFMLLPFVMREVGGMEGIRQTIHNPQFFSLVAPGKIGLFFIVMFSLQALVGIIAQPYIMGTCAAGRTEMDGRVGFMFGNLLKRFCTIAWCLTALAAFAWFKQQGQDPLSVNPDDTYGIVAAKLLPKAGPGLLGVFIAALLASVMDSCAAFMVSSSGLFTENVYRYIVPGRSTPHYLLVARLMSALTVIGGVTFAFSLPNVTRGLDIWLEIAPQIGIAIWLGVLWRRMTTAGAWASAVAACATWAVFNSDWFVAAVHGSRFDTVWGLTSAAGKSFEVYQPWRILAYMAAGLLAGVVVSLFTQPGARERLDRFYALIRTPVLPGEGQPDEPCTLPAGVEAAPRHLLTSFGGLEIPVPSRVSVLGFLAGWACVIALIVTFILIVRYW
jgi:Na+/proline symporter